MKCLKYLDDIGYQIWSGSMIGIPGQTVEDLASDIEFYKEYNVDTIEYNLIIFIIV